jgi:hypothetical protein
MGALYAVPAFMAQSEGVSIRVYLDNITVIAYINHGGGTKSGRLTKVSAELTSWCESRSLSIEAVHVKRKLNVIADKES